MSVDTVQPIIFSPTGTTRRVLTAIGHGIGLSRLTPVDLTLPGGGSRAGAVPQNTLAIIGTPVYAGRVPQAALTRLRHLAGEGAPAVLVVVYGNRAFEDALLELSEFVSARGFASLAAGAFIGEHSFSNAATPIAVGRPDAADLAAAEEFGRQIRRKLETLDREAAYPLLAVPGNFPYRQGNPLAGIAPVSREDVCVRCGECAPVCPMEAIRLAETVETDAGRCIHCCACVRACPTGARVMEHPGLLEIAQRLTTNCAVRKESETFL
jgi:ferredoxin